LTAARVVRRIYTDLAVIDVTEDGFLLREIAEGVDLAGLQAKTEAPLRPASDLKTLRAPAC
jgi:3-oxoadipate CoA-transferase, beta subunit